MNLLRRSHLLDEVFAICHLRVVLFTVLDLNMTVEHLISTTKAGTNYFFILIV